MEIDKITEVIIGCSIEVHKHLGPGLLESTYETCLCFELEKKGLNYNKQLGLPLIYKEIKMDQGYRLDLLVEGKVVVEVKVADGISDLYVAQTLTYLKLSGAPVGLIINFNVSKLTNGIRRLVAKEKT